MDSDSKKIIDAIERYRKGSVEAFGDIYEGCYKLVYTTCYGILKNEEDARDVAQDVFVRIYEKIDTLKNPTAYGKWMKLVASNMSLDFIRRNSHTYNAEEDADLDLMASDWEMFDSLPDSFIEEEEKREIINKVLRDSLSEVQYQTIFMYYFSEMPLSSIAESMECPEGTVKTRLMHAKEKFRKSLEKYVDDNKLVLAATPFLTRFFNASSPRVNIPDIASLGIPGLAAPSGAGAGTAAGAAAGSGTGTAAGAAAKAGFLSTIAGKIAVGAIALTLIGTATVIGTIVFKDKDRPKETTQTTVETAATADTTSASDATADTASTTSVSDLPIGSSYTFGNYRGEDIEWIVLDKKDNGVLLLSKKVIDTQPYNESDVEITWENCTLRGWLHNDFCLSAFSPEERSRLIWTNVVNSDNKDTRARGGSDTNDCVFILSEEEANRYLSSDEVRKAQPCDYLPKDGGFIHDGYIFWWLRTPGNNNKYAAQVGSDGYISGFGDWVTFPNVGVRPAIWISDYPVNNGTTETSVTETVTDPRVHVEDARYETIRNEFDTEMVNRYPRIIIDGVDTSEVNRKMEKDLKRVWKYDSATNTYKGQVINYMECVADYEYNIHGDIVSIIARLSDVDTDYSEYKIYTVSIITGKEVSGSDIVSLYGMSDKEFFEIVKKIYKDFGGGGDYASDAEAKKCIKMNLKRVSYKYIKPFFAKDGHLCFAGYVSFAGAWGEGYILFDATTAGSFYGDD